MSDASTETDLARWAADAIHDAFAHYHSYFKKIARRAKARFEHMDWHGVQQDSVERLDLYTDTVKTTLTRVRKILGENAQNHTVWAQMKREYLALIATRDDSELAETFFNSITRRIFTTVGVDPQIEFVAASERPPLPPGSPVYRVYRGLSTLDMIRAILADTPFDIGYQCAEDDALTVAQAVDAHLAQTMGEARVDAIEMLRSVFYRNKGAYLVGRLCAGERTIPLILPLLNTGQGVFVDAVLLTEDDANIVFGYTRSYFHVDAERPSELMAFLKTIMPLKRVAELYTSLGYNKHGKTELYRDLLNHLARSDDRFVAARGTKGLVMTVFTLPSYHVVFKIIKDQFAPTKTTTREDVVERYQFVFRRDRAGRLIDAQEFEHLEFDKDRFTPELLDELLSVAAHTVKVVGDQVIIKHLYTERRVTPLNLYIMEEPLERAAEAVIEYGNAIKDLAATNIFPGDLFLKNFGVTRHGRVVFYDYDELCLLTDCHFRVMPQRDDFDGLESEPWFSVQENDVFPEQFRNFLGMPGKLREVFLAHHGDLLGIDFWNSMAARHHQGEVVDIYPYRRSKRFVHA